MLKMLALIITIFAAFALGTAQGQSHPVICHTNGQRHCLWVDGTASIR